ncbi:hypothetical protein BDD14_5404 [Edaphobacter modestus]|uniref:L-lysine 6-oxidase n=1 Tax=Edaphobacter modestus TaxID=388466 RepID=A0A4V2G565_9BACT|nr:hypothetical protein BDD14_5404 [Edaphobacter modestus]
MSGNSSVPIYRIHPGIGIARLGDSPDSFCISPETPTALPIACNESGNPLLAADGKTPVTVKTFKDKDGRIKRQAARFQVYVYDETSPEGRPLKIGDPIKGGGNHGTLVDIQWRVYLANKKSAWYEFKQLEGEHGYAANHPLRNPAITDPDARQCLIIDPGPQVVDGTSRRRARFDRTGNGLYAPTFPPEKLQPRHIDTLGELLTDDSGRLLVLGGHGHSGTFNKGFSQPRIDTYANNDGWFDDTSDGPVMARLVMFSTEVGRTRFIDVEYPAWVVSAYPAYVPEILDMVTLDDVLYDTAVTQFAYRTDIYGATGTFQRPQKIDASDAGAIIHWKAANLAWNPDYKPWFYRDIWSILFRADEYTYLTNVLQQSNYPHNQTKRGNFDLLKLSIPPSLNEVAYTGASQRATRANQNGSLFLEALEPVLAQLDQQAANTPSSVRRPLLGGFVQRSDIRKQLRDAVSAFARAVNGDLPEEDGEIDVDAYVVHWQNAYTEGQETGTPAAEKYKAVSDELHTVLRAVLQELYPDKPKLQLLQRREGTQNDDSKPGGDEPVEAAFDRMYTTFRTGKLLTDKLKQLRREYTTDPFVSYRMYLYDLLRKEGEEDVFRLDGKPTSRTHHLPLMPLLCGDNPISNTFTSKFLRLTDYQLYLLRQWSRGMFANELLEGWTPKDKIDAWQPYLGIENHTGRQLDQNVLTNLAGGAFCPGAEVGWIIRNPAIYLKPYRLKADPDFYSFRQTAANESKYQVSEEDYVADVGVTLSLESNYQTGLQPGDLTKMMALPWQADFNECSTQTIDVTYEEWNIIDPSNTHDEWMKREQKLWETLWWPAHRPMQVYEVVGDPSPSPNYQYLSWARGVPQTNAGDLKMVTEWSRLGFVIRNPYADPAFLDTASPDTGVGPPKYISVERNQED